VILSSKSATPEVDGSEGEASRGEEEPRRYPSGVPEMDLPRPWAERGGRPRPRRGGGVYNSPLPLTGEGASWGSARSVILTEICPSTTRQWQSSN